MRLRALLCVLATGAGALTVLQAPVSATPSPTYVPPVDAAVTDPFRPPPGPYGPGNRGLEYGTATGVEVRAAADGVVTFAGLVAGSRHVTLRHPDGLRTTYSFLASIAVVVGQRVGQGALVGTTGGPLHFSARSGDAYLDPASLFDAAGVRVRLVPFDEPPGEGPAGERSAIRQLIGGLGGALDDALGGAVDVAVGTAEWLRDSGAQPLRTALHYAARVGPTAVVTAVIQPTVEAWLTAWAAAHRRCTGATTAPPPPPPGRRVAVLVGGLGSSSEEAAIDDVDTEALGYDTPDVVRFSYRGGRTPDPTDGLAGISATSYAAADTQRDLTASAALLADLLESAVEEAEGAPVDIYAHSQGGVVMRLALLELERRHDPSWLAALGLVATLATPHGGADLATAVYAMGSTRVGSAALDLTGSTLGLALDDDAPAIAQLAETSDVVVELAHRPLPSGLDAVSIAARGDLIVPVPRTQAPGAVQVVVPVVGLHAHAQLPGSPEAGRELALALGGMAPTCTSLQAALVDQLAGVGISWAEDSAGAAAWLGAATLGSPVGG